MLILSSDFKKGYVHLKITDPEDLWYLSQIIEAGDLLKGKTTRKVKIGSEENASVVKKTMVLQIKAETIEYSSERLRINGKVAAGPEDVPLSSYHALELELHTEFSLEKKEWPLYQKEKLQQAAEKKYQYLFCIFDREEAIFALSKNTGFDILLEIQGEAAKKREKVEVKKDFYLQIIALVQEYLLRFQPQKVILASPAFYKEDLFAKITSKDLKEKIVLSSCSAVSRAALDEVIRRPELAAILTSSRSRAESLLMEELLAEIHRQKFAAYGREEVEKAAQAKAICKLLVSSRYIDSQKSAGTYAQLDKLILFVQQSQAEVHFLSSEQDAGKKLDGLCGIAAILRFKLEW